MNANDQYWFGTDMAQVEVGTILPTLQRKMDAVQMFQFSAVTWNAHRIHYDADYARSEGYTAQVAQMHLIGSLLLQLAQRWAGPLSNIKRYRYRVLESCYAGDLLSVSAEVTAVTRSNQREGVGLSVDLSMRIVRNSADRVCSGEVSLGVGPVE